MEQQLAIEFSEEQYKEFFEYHEKNPEIWEKFKSKALEAIKRGYKNFGSKSIFEIIRWERSGDVKSDGYKVNNNFTAYYARLFEMKFPQYKGFFRTRKTSKSISNNVL